jgi:hypothetical protein
MILYQCTGKYTETSERVSHIDSSGLDKAHANTAPRGPLTYRLTTFIADFFRIDSTLLSVGSVLDPSE